MYDSKQHIAQSLWQYPLEVIHQSHELNFIAFYCNSSSKDRRWSAVEGTSQAHGHYGRHHQGHYSKINPTITSPGFLGGSEQDVHSFGGQHSQQHFQRPRQPPLQEDQEFLTPHQHKGHQQHSLAPYGGQESYTPGHGHKGLPPEMQFWLI